MFKRNIIYAILIAAVFSSVAYGKRLPRDFHPFSLEQRHVDTLAAHDLPTGAGEGQMLYWDNTAGSWKATDATKLKWDASSSILTAQDIIIPGLTASLGVYTDGSKQLTSTAPSSGVLGYLTRAGTTLDTANAGDDLNLTGDLNVSTTLLDVDSTLGTVGIGSAAISTAQLNISPSGTKSDGFAGIQSNPMIQPTVSGKAYTGLGLNFTLNGNNSDFVDVSTLKGVESILLLGQSAGGSPTRYKGTITKAVGFTTTASMPGIGANIKFITEYKHFEVTAPVFGANVDIGTLYGLHIADVTNTEVATAWAIKLDGGNSFTAGPWYFGQTDGDERVVSDTDGTLDLYAGTNVNFYIGGNNDLTLSADTLDMQGSVITDLSGLHFNSATELTISSGAITVTQGHHSIDTEADATDDDLDTINGGNAGEILLILPANDDRTVRIRHGVGNIYLKHQTASQSYNFNSPQGSSGIFYKAGFYDFPTTDANLDQAGTTQTEGDTNGTHAAHASLIASGPGTATGGSGAVTIVVSGTSIDDSSNRVTSDSEVIVADITAMSTDQYFETSKKWLGTITYTLTVGATGHTAYAADFNYGLSKYEDIGNTNFSITFFEYVGRAGANDTGFNVRLIHHNAADWTYAATGFVPGPTAGDASELANMNTTHGVEKVLNNDDPFAYKRDDLNQDIAGDNGEGIIIEITTSTNRAVESMDIHIGVHSAPKFGYMATTKQHLMFMKHGPNWLEL